MLPCSSTKNPNPETQTTCLQILERNNWVIKLKFNLSFNNWLTALPSWPMHTPLWMIHESPIMQLLSATLNLQKENIHSYSYYQTLKVDCRCRKMSYLKYPIFVDWPMVTAGPTTVPDPIHTFAPSTAFEWTIAPTSISTVESIQADWWKIPPPLCHFWNCWRLSMSETYKSMCKVPVKHFLEHLDGRNWTADCMSITTITLTGLSRKEIAKSTKVLFICLGETIIMDKSFNRHKQLK